MNDDKKVETATDATEKASTEEVKTEAAK